MPRDVYTLAELRDWHSATASEGVPIRLSVFGDPISHSRSPQMHNPALEAAGIPAAYARIHIHKAELAEALRLLPGLGFIGTNVTIPHKAAVMALMDEVDPAAKRAGGVNTVVVRGDKLAGFSTDGPGFSRAIRADFGVDLNQMRVLILGAAGGAGRAIAMQCAAEGAARLVLVNRTFDKAQALAAELAPSFREARATGHLTRLARLEAVPWHDAALARQFSSIDLVVNATPIGMHSGASPNARPFHDSLLRSHHLVYDTVYAPHRTPLLRAADEAGARSSDGLSMLLHQGALSFEIWFGRPAPLDVMRAALLEQ